MERNIELTASEATLRQLLLDVCNYIGTVDGHTRPHLRFTGGWVRDKLLGVASKDIDVGIDSMTGYNFGKLMNKYLELPEAKTKHPESVLAKLGKIEANPEKSKHLETVATKILGFDVDLVNLRKETYAEDSRNPQMEFGSPEEDALRRDATVNALFYNLDESKVEDFTGKGLDDMRRGLIRTPDKPDQTFKDDPLRVLRAIRFASRLGWPIHEEDKRAMSDDEIKTALKTKISRERVGIELTKMLKDPVTHRALGFIDRLKLYDTVFTRPNNKNLPAVGTGNWQKAYDQMQAFVSAKAEAPAQIPREQTSKTTDHLMNILSILLRYSSDAIDDIYHAWLLCAFVPWARLSHANASHPKEKASLAALVAREGLKANNHEVKLIDNSVRDLDDIINIKDSVAKSSTVQIERDQDPFTRSEQGMAIRRWGPTWRSSVMFALLTQIAEHPQEAHEHILEDYAKWLTRLKRLDLLEAYKLEPLVKGDMVLAKIHSKPGAWMSKAIEMGIRWQLEHPGSDDVDAAISYIIERKDSLDLSRKRKSSS